MSSNFLKSSSYIKIQNVSSNQGLNEKEMISCPQIQTLCMPACGLFFIFHLVFNAILTGLFTSFSSSLKMRSKGQTAKSRPSDGSEK